MADVPLVRTKQNQMKTSPIPLPRISRSESMLAKAQAAYLARIAKADASAEAKHISHSISIDQVAAMTALLD